MRNYFDGLSVNLRNILRGEVSGSVGLVAFVLLSLVIWFSVWTLHGWNAQSQAALTSQKGRLNTLFLLGNEYKSLSPSESSRSGKNVDVATVFAQVSENMAKLAADTDHAKAALKPRSQHNCRRTSGVAGR